MAYGASMGKARADSHDWRSKRKCGKLSPEQADRLFFPPPGGKKKQAELFCDTCPVKSKCLDWAISTGQVGMWAGTTEDERRRMTKFLGLVVQQLDNFMPPEPTRHDRKLRPIRQDPNILGDPLFGVNGPADDELSLIEANPRSFGL